jgi:signal transduction histidine kinase
VTCVRPHEQSSRQGAKALAHALRTHQVDAIVGEHQLMLVRVKQAEDDLEKSRDELRALAAGLQSVREEERTAIAREIHDELGQTLTSLQLGLAWIATRLVASRQQPLQAKVTALEALVTSLIRSVRTIAAALRPGVLDELGLARALKAEAREFKRNTGIPCGFRCNVGRVTLDRAGAVAVFRIAQAALTNVARHAKASRASVALARGGRDLVLTVHDDGKGIRANDVSSPGALGILGMRERARALGGTLTVAGSRARGTTLRARFPLSRVLAETAP